MNASISRPSNDPPQFFSESDCHEILQRLIHFARGGGSTQLRISSTWLGNVRWGRNQIRTSGDIRDDSLEIIRTINGASGDTTINDTTDAGLVTALRRAERRVATGTECVQDEVQEHWPLEVASRPPLSSIAATYNLDAAHRAEIARQSAQSAKAAGMLSAGYLEVMATSQAKLDSAGRSRFYQYTSAQLSVTVRDPKGIGSGWAGLSALDWNRIDPAALTAVALDKCLHSRNPVAIEPGRYTTILEPQAVSDFIGRLFGDPVANQYRDTFNRASAEDMQASTSPFGKIPRQDHEPGYSRLGDQIVDPRITVSTDPMDPEISYPPYSEDALFGFADDVYHATTWIEHGVLKNLSYGRTYGIQQLGRDTGMPNSGAFRMSGGATSIEEMITTTKRGLLVTRFDQVEERDPRSQLFRGVTRDGLWLIENGKIAKAVKNMRFVESILFALNNVDQLGVPQRVLRPARYMGYGYIIDPQPAVVPPLKIKDFSFTALTDAI